ncbi:DUF1080 domain-containing protein [Pedobacter psychroterrae]|uniref:DUF1080 domain-containing protein n=1 Tax=Pedobacter psychroterrae TaxID=2530453 RepID=A0A4V2MLF1_9SPHI|nr:DUF1080 domain-containing protein [Pedobacter psychroterrae]
MKRILFVLLAIVMLYDVALAQNTDQRTVTTRIADLLAQLPSDDAKQLKSNMQDISQLGVDGYVTLISGLVPQGKGNNSLIEYAVSGFSGYVSQPGQESLRKMAADAYCKVLPQLSDKQNKSFIISQFELVGDDASVACLSAYLKDADLADPASRSLVKINTPAAKAALIAALSGGTPERALVSVIEALGHTGSKEAATAIKQLISGVSTAELSKVSLFSLAHIADPSAESVLAKAAESAGYKYEQTNAVAAYLLFAQKSLATDKALSAKIAKQLLSNVKDEQQVDIRIAALKLLAESDNSQEYLLAAMDDSNFEYKAAALGFALPGLTADNTAQWVKKIAKADPATQVAILSTLGESKSQTALPAIVKLLKHKDASVRHAAIAAAAKIGQEAALEDFLKATAKADAADLTAYSDAILRMKGDGITSKIAAYIPKAKPNVQVALINVLAARAAGAQSATVFSLLANKNPEVRSAAFAALSKTAGSDNLPQLYTLLNETTDQTELIKVQDAVIAALSSGQNADQQVDAVLTQMAAAPDDKKLLFYKVLGSLGGAKSLAAVSTAFNSGNEASKKAALDALSAWVDAGSAEELIKIARQTSDAAYLDQALQGYLRLISASPASAEQKLLLLRNAMDVAKTTAQKQQILKQTEQAKSFNAIVFAGKYLDDPALQQAAANAVMNITMAGKYNGTIVKDLLNKTITVITGPDSGYQKEGMKKYISEMSAEEGFVKVFNGTDLTGWKGLVGDPIKRSKMDAKTLAEAQAKADEVAQKGWKVVNGELQFQIHGDNLATVKKYGDMEMLVDWKIIDDKKGEGDAGIYLRGTPQVQIWDLARTNVGAQVGSGGLYNNQTNPSKPLKVADNKLDEWNTFRILMKGDRVTVWLNGELVTDNVVLENFWDRSLPIFAEEQIELQAHGSPVAYRDIYIREIPRPKPFELSAQEKKEGYQVLFDGTNMHSWMGNTTDYVIENGNIAIRPVPGKGSGGNLFTKKEYSDFVFRFEFQLTTGANNGLGIRAPLEGDAAYTGMELQILDNEAPIYKDLHVYQYHGSVYGTMAAKRGFLKPLGEWNYQEVIVNGPKIKVILNGTVILDGDLTPFRKNGTPDKLDHPGIHRASGHIGFLGHGSPLQFRNIRVKELKNTKK